MKLFRILCWLVLPLCFGIIQSCCSCDTISYTYSITDLALQNLDNGGPQPIVTTSDSIGKKVYGIKLTWGTTKVAYHSPLSSLFMQSAYASDVCNCNPFVGWTKDTIITLKIITINGFDTSHVAGADVSAYFFEDGLHPIQQSALLEKPSLFLSQKPGSVAMNCILMQAPETASQQQFQVEVEFSGGRKMSAFTNPVTLY